MSERFALIRARQEVLALCHAGHDSATLRRELLRKLKPVLNYAACSIMTMDPATSLVTGAVTDGLAPSGARHVFANEYLEADFNKLTDLARGPEHTGILLLATGGEPNRSRRYRDLLTQRGFGSELRAAFVVDGSCWGGALVYRFQDQAPFTPLEAGFLEAVGPHIALGLRNAVLLSRAQQPVGPEAPGLLLLDDSARMISMSEQAEHYLSALGEEWRSQELPPPIYALDAYVRALAKGAAPPDAGPARLRIATGQGDWLAFHATIMNGDLGSVAIMVERARPAEVAPLVFDAYGLTPREREVAQRVLSGLSTKEIAQALVISEHTVQDHIKAIFVKTGVSSRRELSGRIFFDAYDPAPRER